MRAFWSRLSIRRKLSLLIGGLVLVVAATYSWAAYGGMRRAALTSARLRLRSVTDQLAVMLQTSGKAYPGTGIGLAIVRKGMERMGGRAGVESRPGEGSVFWIELPAAERAHERERQYDSAG